MGNVYESRRYSTSSTSRSSRPSYNRFGSSNSSSRGSFQRRPGGFSGGYNRPRFGNRNRNQVVLNESLFIKKAEKVQEQEKYVAKYKFSDFGLSPALLNNIQKKGYVTPTPIQDQAIKHVLEGKDLLGIANTGTGKTGVFLIPLVQKVTQSKQNRVLILVPTRELAEQINDELYSLTKDLRIFSVKCIGGESISKQMYLLDRGYSFLIGTPGRINDLIDRRAIDLQAFKTVILDEVDRMLDMGFLDEIKELISRLPKEKQSLFFSATMDKKVDRLIDMILKPGFIRISISPEKPAQNIDQDVVYYKDSDDKISKLKNLLKEPHLEKVLIFVNTKREADRLDRTLYSDGKVSVASIHGDKRQNDRKRAIEKFKEGRAKVLVATDVAARGLDVEMYLML